MRQDSTFFKIGQKLITEKEIATNCPVYCEREDINLNNDVPFHMSIEINKWVRFIDGVWLIHDEWREYFSYNMRLFLSSETCKGEVTWHYDDGKSVRMLTTLCCTLNQRRLLQLIYFEDLGDKGQGILPPSLRRKKD
jgi:hypothetical protein